METDTADAHAEADVEVVDIDNSDDEGGDVHEGEEGDEAPLECPEGLDPDIFASLPR